MIATWPSVTGRLALATSLTQTQLEAMGFRRTARKAPGRPADATSRPEVNLFT